MSHTHAGANTNSQLTGKPGVGADRALPRAPRRRRSATRSSRRRRRPRRHGSPTATAAARSPRTGTSGTRRQRGSHAATTPDESPTTPCSSRGSPAGRARARRRSSTTPAIRPPSPGQNRLLSPDYIGAAREVLETAFGAPALFLQGASGELAPRDDYVGDAAVADRNGRQLGYAAAAAVESLPPPGTPLRLHGDRRLGRQPRRLGVPAVRRGATRGQRTARGRAAPPSSSQRKEDLGVVESAPAPRPTRRRSERRRCAASSSARARRRAGARDAAVGWRLGEALLVASATSPTPSSRQLRGASPGTPVFVLMTTNGGVGYLPPRETYGTGRYQEQQSPYAPGCLEQSIAGSGRRAGAALRLSSRRRRRRASSAAAAARRATGASAPRPRRARGRGPGPAAARRSRPRRRGAFGKSS